MEFIQGILLYCYFTKNVTSTKRSVSTVLHSLVSQVSIYLLTTKWVPRAMLGAVRATNEDMNSQPTLLQSCQVRSLTWDQAQPTFLQWQLHLPKTLPDRPLPHLIYGQFQAAKKLSTQLSSWGSRALDIISVLLCPSWNGILSRYFSFINIHLPKANSNHSWTPSSFEWVVNLSGGSIPPERVIFTYAGDV